MAAGERATATRVRWWASRLSVFAYEPNVAHYLPLLLSHGWIAPRCCRPKEKLLKMRRFSLEFSRHGTSLTSEPFSAGMPRVMGRPIRMQCPGEVFGDDQHPRLFLEALGEVDSTIGCTLGLLQR